MKKKLASLLLILAMGIALPSCGRSASSTPDSDSSVPSSSTPSQDSSSSPVSSSVEEIITGITLSGPSSLDVGRSFTLGVDVVGSEDDSAVTVESSDEKIASVDGLKITGVSAGAVVITVTSTKNPSIQATKELTVNARYDYKELNVSLSGNDDISYDSSTGAYNVPLGQTFRIDTSVDNDIVEGYTASFSVVYPTSQQDNNFVIEQKEGDIFATGRAMTKYVGLAIVVSAYYQNGISTSSLSKTIYINVFEVNIDESAKALSLISSLKEDDISKASISVKEGLEKKDDNGNTVTTSSSVDYVASSYSDGANLSVTSVSGDNITEERYFSTIENNRHYVFSYDPTSKAVTDILVNEASSATNANDVFLVEGTSVTSTIKTILENFLGESTGSFYMLGDGYANAYASYSFFENGDGFSVTSKFETDQDENVEISFRFEIDASNENSFVGYSFEESIENVETGQVKTYSSKSNSVTHDGRNALNPDIDMDAYYFDSDTLDSELATDKDAEGRYDFSDPDKYFAGDGTLEDGIMTYKLFTYQALALRIKRKDGSDSLATTAIDNFTLSSSDTSVVSNDITMLANSDDVSGSGIYVFSPYKNSSGIVSTGSSIITLTSTKGAVIKFKLEFVENEVSAVNATGGALNDDTGKTNLGTIRVGQHSSNFTLNATPDEATYVFNLVVVTGDLDGIELEEIPDDNVEGLYGYWIKALKAGTYTFKFGVGGSEIVTENTYTLTVLDALTDAQVKAGLVDSGKTYVYATSLYSFTAKFNSLTSLTISETYMDYDSNSEVTVEGDIAIECEGGIITVMEQSLPEGFYFSSISGEIAFDEDFENLVIYLAIGSDVEGTAVSYSPYTFEKYVDTSDPMGYLPGKSYSIQDFNNLGSGYGNYKVSLEFASDGYTAVLKATKIGSSEEAFRITFTYSYDSASGKLVTSDVTYSNENVKFKENPDYLGSSIKFYLSVSGSDLTTYLSFEI